MRGLAVQTPQLRRWQDHCEKEMDAAFRTGRFVGLPLAHYSRFPRTNGASAPFYLFVLQNLAHLFSGAQPEHLRFAMTLPRAPTMHERTSFALDLVSRVLYPRIIHTMRRSMHFGSLKSCLKFDSNKGRLPRSNANFSGLSTRSFCAQTLLTLNFSPMDRETSTTA